MNPEPPHDCLCHLLFFAVNSHVRHVSNIICVFQPGVCRVCKPPITFTPNYTLKDVIRPARSITTQRDITVHQGTLWRGKVYSKTSNTHMHCN